MNDQCLPVEIECLTGAIATGAVWGRYRNPIFISLPARLVSNVWFMKLCVKWQLYPLQNLQTSNTSTTETIAVGSDAKPTRRRHRVRISWWNVLCFSFLLEQVANCWLVANKNNNWTKSRYRSPVNMFQLELSERSTLQWFSETVTGFLVSETCAIAINLRLLKCTEE